MASEAVSDINVLEMDEEAEASTEEERSSAGEVSGGQREMDRLDVDRRDSVDSKNISYSTLLTREHSMLIYRDRSKSLDGGIIHQPISRPSQSSVVPKLTSFWNSFAYGPVMVTLRNLRRTFKEKESKKWNSVTGFVEKVVSSIFFKLLMLLVVLSHAVLLCFYLPEVRGDVQHFNQYVYYAIIGYVLFYVVEALLNITAYGLLLNPRESFFRRPIYILDLLIIILGVFYLSLRDSEPAIAEVFSSFMALKMLKILALLSSRVRFILKVLAKSVKPLFHLGALTFVVVLFFAIMGIELFQGDLHGGCYANYTTPAGDNRSILVSEFPCPIDSDPVGSHECPNRSVCMTWETGPHQGLVSFDNILLGMIVVFQCITLEGWSVVFYLYESSVGVAYAWVYFVVVILVGSVFILNLLVGVLTNVFIGVSDREELKGNSRRNKAKKRIENDLNDYNEWMKKGAELLQPYDVTGSIERFPTWTPNAGSSSDDDDEVEDATTRLQVDAESWTSRRDDSSDKKFDYYELQEFPVFDSMQKLTSNIWMEAEIQTSKCWCGWYYYSSRKLCMVVRSKVWFWLNIMAHAINLIFLMSFHFPSSSSYDKGIYILNYVFSCLYVVDLLLKIYAIGPIGFFKRKKIYQILFNIGEVFLALLSIAGLVTDFVTNFHLLVLVNAVWSLKLVLIGKISRNSWKHLKEVLGTLGQLITSIASVLYIIGIFMFIFTIMGLRLFGNRLNLTINNQQPNFDTFWNSMLLVFQLLTSEDWHNILYVTSTAITYEETNTIGYLTSIYFLVGIFLGSIILVTVLLALVVDKLSEVRASEEDQEKEREELQKERELRSEQLSALRGPEKNVQRRTIRRLIRYQAHNPAERARALRKEENKKYWRQSSLPQFPQKLMKNFSFSNLDFHRASSIPPNSPMSNVETERDKQKLDSIEEESDSEMINQNAIIGDRTWSQGRYHSGGAGNTRTVLPATSKRVNPLRLVKEPSSFIDEQILRMSGRITDNPVVATAQSRRAGRMKSKKSERKGEKLKNKKAAEATFDPKTLSDLGESSPSDRHLSVYTSPTHELKVIEEERVEEEQEAAELFSGKPEVSPIPPSSPSILQSDSAGDGLQNRADSSLSTHSYGRQTFSRQSNIDIEEEEGSSNTQKWVEELDRDHLSTTPMKLSFESSLEVQTPQRYTRGSSLEPIHPWREQRRHSDGRIKKTTKEKILNKVTKALTWMKVYFGSFQHDPTQELAKIPPHSSFFIFDHESSFRQFCFKIVRSLPFQTISYTTVILSSLLLMLEIPNGSSDDFLCGIQNNIIWIDIGFIVFFLVEIILKMIALGVILHRDSYLRGLFNIVDFVIMILNLIPIIVYFSHVQLQHNSCVSYGYDTAVLSTSIGALRVSRVFRPLRAFRIGGLRLVVSGIFSSIKATLSIFFIDGLFIIIFAVIGINYFRGTFNYCTDPNVITEDTCLGFYLKYDYAMESNSSIPGLACPQTIKREWLNQELNFDNIANAILTLFTMLTAEGWENVMYNGINSQKLLESMRPLGTKLENSMASSLYFVLYMIVTTFILLQLFVGFVIVTFQEVGVTSYKETRMNRNQRHCLHFALTTKPTRQWIPRYEFQRRLRKSLLPIIKSYKAKVLIFVALLVNVIVLALQIYGFEQMKQIINYINDAFTIFFLLEVAVRILILTPPIYFRSIWNTFEFLIAFGSSVELFIFCWAYNQHSHVLTAFRVLRLLRFYPAVRKILWIVINSLEVFPWVGYLLVIVVFIYSVLGMHLFGTIKQASIDIAERDGIGIHVYNNFATFPNALLVMIRVITGENWPDVMLSSISGQECEAPLNESNNSSASFTCGNDFAYFFYPSFYVISTIMILNLFVAVIIDNFDYVIRDKSILGAYDLNQFVSQWFKIDKETRGTLTPNEVFGLFRKLNPPVGWGKLCPQIMAYKKMMRLNIPIFYEQERVEGSTEMREVKKVTFNATLFALVKNVLKIGCTGCPDCAKKCNKGLRERLMKCFPTMEQKLIDNVLAKETDETVASEYAVLMVQAEWRSFMMRRRRLIETFHGSEGGTLKVHRNIPDPGPDPRHRRISHFGHDLEDNYPVPRKFSETSSVFSDRSKEGSHSPVGIRGLPPPINTKDDVSMDERYKRSCSPSYLSPPPLTHFPRPLSPNLEVEFPTSSSGDRPSYLPLDEIRSSKEGKQFIFNEAPRRNTKRISSATEEEGDVVVAESPIWGKKSEADTVSFTSAYSQLHESLESLQLPETTV